jgi:hypothetical protein
MVLLMLKPPMFYFIYKQLVCQFHQKKIKKCIRISPNAFIVRLLAKKYFFLTLISNYFILVYSSKLWFLYPIYGLLTI